MSLSPLLAVLLLVVGYLAVIPQLPQLRDRLSLIPDPAVVAEQAKVLTVARSYRQAEALFVSAASAQPLAPRNLAGLAIARDATQPLKADDGMIRMLEQMGWNDPSVQSFLLRFLIDNDQVPRAVPQADALLRLGSVNQVPLAVLELAQDDPISREKLIEALAQNPPWKTDYISDISNIDEQSMRKRLNILAVARKRGLNLDAPGAARLANLVIGLDQPGLALQSWRAMVETNCQDPVVWDCRFDFLARNFQPPKNYVRSRFEWSPQHNDNADVQVNSAGGNGTVLRVDWDGRSKPAFIRQTIAIKPGAVFVVKSGGEMADLGKRSEEHTSEL